jgi:hypothetical protein
MVRGAIEVLSEQTASTAGRWIRLGELGEIWFKQNRSLCRFCISGIGANLGLMCSGGWRLGKKPKIWFRKYS